MTEGDTAATWGRARRPHRIEVVRVPFAQRAVYSSCRRRIRSEASAIQMRCQSLTSEPSAHEVNQRAAAPMHGTGCRALQNARRAGFRIASAAQPRRAGRLTVTQSRSFPCGLGPRAAVIQEAWHAVRSSAESFESAGLAGVVNLVSNCRRSR